MNVSEVRNLMNQFGREKTAFLFMVDFEMEKPLIFPLSTAFEKKVKFSMQDNFLNIQNASPKTHSEETELLINKNPIDFRQYQKAFEQVKSNILLGNSFLTNLTAETEIESNWSLDSIFDHCAAKYKLYLEGQFLCFSPETFVQIDVSGKISSFPMKGTIDAHLPNAEATILADRKEFYEHTTIVDLIRNDLSKIAQKVWVERFRYIEKIKRQDGSELLQVSSEVCGHLQSDWNNQLGDLLFELLPAGSISGAPKPKTLEIIKEAEKLTYRSPNRGYYSGVFGVFDGEKLNSAVMIRFIEKQGEKLVFKSGGGITSRSKPKKEYDELLSKIYVPIL